MNDRERWARVLVGAGMSPADAERVIRWYERDRRPLTDSEAELAGDVAAIDIESARAWWIFTLGLIGAVRFTRILEAFDGKSGN